MSMTIPLHALQMSTPTIEELQAENARLKAQVNMLKGEGVAREKIEQMSSEVNDENPYRYTLCSRLLVNTCLNQLLLLMPEMESRSLLVSTLLSTVASWLCSGWVLWITTR